jgi:GntR family transcriptional regulator/MocR family aminotransferase
LSSERRKELLDYAVENEAWIIEDDYDGEYRYDSRPSPTMQSKDRHGRVIYVGSFSKTFFPSIRLGYVVVPPALRNAFIAGKFLEDMGAPVVVQAAMAFLLEEGAFDRHLVKSVRELKIRRDALVEGLRAINPEFRISGTHAGMHLVVSLPGWTPELVEELKKVALGKGLAIFSTVPYYRGVATQPGLLMGYASTSVAEIARGLRILKDALRELEKSR